MVLIKSFEGFRPRAVQDDDGRWVIGYGHTASAREGLTISEPDAELLLQYDLMPVVRALNEQIRQPLNQHQFDALASFAVSVGVDRFLSSDVLQRLNEGHAGQAADALIGWPSDVTVDTRLRRRAAERALFVADPASAVTLAELLAAPLPPPAVEAPPVEAPADAGADSGADAVPAWAPEAPAFESPAFQPAAAVTRVNLDRYSPYAAAIIGPLPGFASAEPAVVSDIPPPSGPEPVTPDPEPAPEPAPALVEPDVPVTPLVSADPVPSPFPAMDPELVLTPATEADFVETGRPVWPADQNAPVPAAEDTVLFEDEPTLSVLRHEVEPAGPRRFDWADTGAFLIMGVTGLVACAASAAAFRLSIEKPSDMGETTVLGWVLALIGVICVGVSSWKLYVRWGKPD